MFAVEIALHRVPCGPQLEIQRFSLHECLQPDRWRLEAFHMVLSKVELRRTEKFWVLCVSGTATTTTASNKRVISSPDQTSRGLGSSRLPAAMELKTPSASSSDLNACLVAFRYAELASTAEVVVDETVPGLELSASTGGDGVKGLSAVLR